jgi:hypothetical protein
MDELCPNCKKPLTTKTIIKKMSQGVIEYPVAKICPKCRWNRDLTGAGDIISEPVLKRERDIKHGKPLKPIAQTGKESESSSSMNLFIVLALIVLVIGGLAFAFLTQVPVKSLFIQNSTPGINQKSINATAETPVPEDTVVPTGKKWPVLLDYSRGFLRNNDLTIKLGDEVVWDNINTVPVTLVSKDDLFENILLDYGKQASFIIKKPGVYVFYLEKNRNMTGTITVIKP